MPPHHSLATATSSPLEQPRSRPWPKAQTVMWKMQAKSYHPGMGSTERYLANPNPYPKNSAPGPVVPAAEGFGTRLFTGGPIKRQPLGEAALEPRFDPGIPFRE